MPKEEIDQDVLDFIRSQVRDFGETPSTVLRRLLGISPRLDDAVNSPSVEIANAETSEVPTVVANQSDTPRRIRSRHSGTAIERYLSILSELYLENPDRFEGVESVKGRRRIYFHTSSQVIEDSGNSVMPRRIPGTPYHAATNLSDPKKMRILEEVLRVLRIYGEEKTSYLSALDPDYVGL